jgi:hypothetical protein
MRSTVLDGERLASFERNGYVHLPGVLAQSEVVALKDAIGELATQGHATADSRTWWGTFHAGDHIPHAPQTVDLRNIAGTHPAFADLIDAEAILFPVVQILGPRIALLSSHGVIRARNPEVSAEQLARMSLSWHRDLGISSIEMTHPQPRLAVKAAIWLTPLTGEGQGALRVVPGSHRLPGEPVRDSRTNQPYGWTEVLAQPGDVTVFEQRLWHAAAPNIGASPRVSLFYGYGYRWLRAQDYSDLSPALLGELSPVRRQLLGAKVTVMGHHLPTADDVPLAAWYEEKVRAHATANDA